MPDVLVFAAIIPRLFGCKLILDLHDTVPETYQAKFGKISRLCLCFLRFEERICCFVAHRIVCVNHVQRDVVIQRGVPADKIATVITMPRFISQVRSCRARRGGTGLPGGKSWDDVQRLGNDLIIQAGAKLVHEIPGFELHIIGGGDNFGRSAFPESILGFRGSCAFSRQSSRGMSWRRN